MTAIPPSQSPTSEPSDNSPQAPAQSPPVQAAAGPGYAAGPPWWTSPPKKKSLAWKIVKVFCWSIFFFSLLLNFWLIAALTTSMEHGQMKKKVLQAGRGDQTIAVFEVKGVIDDSQTARLTKFCDETAGDGNVKAVVLRVDSPGGGLSASDQMCRQVKRLKQAGKKVVVSMGGVAASGGYYISAPADEIFAEPTTLTGSIGVIATWIVVKDGLEKLGIQPVVMKSSSSRNWKDEMSVFQQPNDKQKEHIQALLDACQVQFDKVVTEGRGERLRKKEVAYEYKFGAGPDAKIIIGKEVEPLNAKVYMGDDAKSQGLVDQIGYLDDAINRTKSLAGLSEAQVMKYEHQTGLLDFILQGKADQSLQLSTRLLDEFQSVRFMAIWKGQ
ncbi:MAG: S49 family peptidase [Planctomycetes bacterium]|nr:S49 family peptidase [Planctomycetota bacterium]